MEQSWASKKGGLPRPGSTTASLVIRSSATIYKATMQPTRRMQVRVKIIRFMLSVWYCLAIAPLPKLGTLSAAFRQVSCISCDYVSRSRRL